MTVAELPAVEVSPAILDAIAQLPTSRTVHHCGEASTVSPFDLYASCPHCGKRVKVRAFGGGLDVEDVFDAVFAWMNQPGAAAAAEKRRREIAADEG